MFVASGNNQNSDAGKLSASGEGLSVAGDETFVGHLPKKTFETNARAALNVEGAGYFSLAGFPLIGLNKL